MKIWFYNTTITISWQKLDNRSLHLFKLVANPGATLQTPVNDLIWPLFWPDSDLKIPIGLHSTPYNRIFLAQSLYLEGADPLDPSMDYVIDDDGYGDVIDPASDAFSLDLEAYELSQAGYNVDPEYDFLEW